MSGRQVGNYRILDYIGGGGFGSVFKAEDLGTPGRIVAIKELHKKHTRSPVLKQRFFQEAVAMARLDHPNLPRLYTFGEDNGLYYLVMEFLSGKSLTEELHERGRIEPDEAITIIGQVLEAINYAHQNGIIHRDLKPDNIMLCRDDEALRVKVLDFGIARMIGGDNLTVAGEGLGTPAYMSPERIAGSTDIDQRTDIYSAGIILYEMLSGKVPFESNSTDPATYWTEMRRLHESQPLSPLSSFGIARELERVVNKATAKRPEERYATADEMLAELKVAAGEQEDIAERPAHLLLTVAPSPAEVYVDDTYRGSSDGESGRLLIEGLTPGLHSVRVARMGYNEYRISVALEAGRRTDLQVAMAARSTVAMPPAAETEPADAGTQKLRAGHADKTATLVLDSLPSGSTVFVGTQAIGLADASGRATLELNQGVHQIQVASPSGNIIKREVTVTEQDTGKLKTVNLTVATPVPVVEQAPERPEPIPETEPIPEEVAAKVSRPSRAGRRIAWAVFVILLLALAAFGYWVIRNPGRFAAQENAAGTPPLSAAPATVAERPPTPAPPDAPQSPDKKVESTDQKAADADEEDAKEAASEETDPDADPEPSEDEETAPAPAEGSEQACVIVEVKGADGNPVPNVQVLVGQRPRAGAGIFSPGMTGPGGRSRHCDLPVGARVGVRVVRNGRVIGKGATEVVAGGRLIPIQVMEPADAPREGRPLFPNRRQRRMQRLNN